MGTIKTRGDRQRLWTPPVSTSIPVPIPAPSAFNRIPIPMPVPSSISLAVTCPSLSISHFHFHACPHLTHPCPHLKPHAHDVPTLVLALFLSPCLSLCYAHSHICAECCLHACCPSPMSSLPSFLCQCHPMPLLSSLLSPCHFHTLLSPCLPMPLPNPCCSHASPCYPMPLLSPCLSHSRWHIQVRTRSVPGAPRCCSRWAWMKISKACPGVSPVTSKVTADPGSSWVVSAAGSSCRQRTCQRHTEDTMWDLFLSQAGGHSQWLLLELGDVSGTQWGHITAPILGCRRVATVTEDVLGTSRRWVTPPQLILGTRDTMRRCLHS